MFLDSVLVTNTSVILFKLLPWYMFSEINNKDTSQHLSSKLHKLSPSHPLGQAASGRYISLKNPISPYKNHTLARTRLRSYICYCVRRLEVSRNGIVCFLTYFKSKRRNKLKNYRMEFHTVFTKRRNNPWGRLKCIYSSLRFV